jgi:glycosyltransferase involved in cell wall biosynthesis
LAKQELVSEAITIVIPVFNDRKALGRLLARLDESLLNERAEIGVLVVDDGSSTQNYEDFIPADLKAIRKVDVLELRRNLGHQRAIAVGLAYVEANVASQAVLVMDGDGEDDPREVPRLLARCREEGYEKLVFAKRTKRSESWFFKLFYYAYRWLYRLLTGYEIRVGNFSVVPRGVLRRIVGVSEIWNHYAVGILKAKVSHVEVPTKRGTRLAGNPRMNFSSLVTHGLSAVSVHGDVMGVRLFVATLFLLLLVVAALVSVVIIKLATDLTIPDWASYVGSLLLMILIQTVLLTWFFSFLVLSGRSVSNFLPQRDHQYFVLDIRRIYPS